MSDAPAPLPPIVCLAGIDWDSLWQRSQILMSGFAQRGARVAYVEQLDAGRAIGVRDWRRIAARGRNLLRRRDRRYRGVQVITPTILPFRLAGAVNRHLLRRLAWRVQRLGFRDAIVWSYSGAPNTSMLERWLSPSLLIYDCVTRVRGYEYATPRMIDAEEALTRRSDLVITDARILWEEKRVLNPKCEQLPPGADFEVFAPRPDSQEAPTLRGLLRPRLGFFGAINNRLDQAALARFAASHPGWAVVLIGPVMVDLSVLKSAPNIFVYPPVSHAELGAWLQAVDVIAIPYLANEFTKGIIPAKLFEALATGKPVVAMGLPELEPYARVIQLCEPDGFEDAIERALESDSATRREERLALARQNSWTSRVDRAWQLLLDAWQAKRAATAGPDRAALTAR